MIPDEILGAHINGCEYFHQPQINRMYNKLLAGDATQSELQQIIAIQMRQIHMMVEEKRKTDNDMKEIRQIQRQQSITITQLNRVSNGKICRIIKEKIHNFPDSSIDFFGWCNTLKVTHLHLEQVAKNGIVSAFRMCFNENIQMYLEIPSSETVILPIYAFKDKHKIYVYNPDNTPRWNIINGIDTDIMMRRFRLLLKKEWFVWEDENREYLYSTEEGFSEYENLRQKVFNYEIPKKEYKPMYEYMYQKLTKLEVTEVGGEP